ncbi:phospho-sugar mutase [Brucepastera parasyntrophica]|uniref:phospho-sugar mutase n=1 Tax=Brucepastera parasyntrophica TaxID=2880008 RepID=UPI00210BC1EB|nr:phospho-sugar mutase [Brucepastera parasyntrophica]ULQ60194.1 phospho-sugar mutase [Brucepastera parasyntrophica]
MDTQTILARAQAYIDEEKDEKFADEVKELISSSNIKELEDRFYQNLEFGTGGLRGVIGGGTNRMNTLVVTRATQGLVNYFLKTFPEKAKNNSLSAVIAYDSRHYSDVFGEATALIFAANGFKTYLFTGLRPTPELSFAIRTLGCDTGVVITASHNPPQYNGYKAYWNDGAQVIEPHDEGIIDEVNAVKEVKTISREEAVSSGKLVLIDSEIDEKYWAMVKSKLFRPDLIREQAGNVKIVYTPLHGTGAMHVEKVLEDLGLKVLTVPRQREPDGNFPTVAKPNPEEAAALKMAIELAEKEKADVVMSTDPDADRFGGAVPGPDGKFVLITGNQMGALLVDYICLSRKELDRMPPNPAVIRSIVTSTFGDRIANSYGVETKECLTGFKWIASVMADFEKTGSHNYIFGYEESYGYNIETEVRDKDGISAAALCAEMTLYWRSKGKSLLDRLNEMYMQHGYFKEYTINKDFPGASGGAAMKNLMATLRKDGLKILDGKKVLTIRDIQEGTIYSPVEPDKKSETGLPRSNVLQFFLEDGSIVSVRPSGTEPKIKFYISCPAPVSGRDLDEAKKIADTAVMDMEAEIHRILGTI